MITFEFAIPAELTAALAVAKTAMARRAEYVDLGDRLAGQLGSATAARDLAKAKLEEVETELALALAMAEADRAVAGAAAVPRKAAPAAAVSPAERDRLKAMLDEAEAAVEAIARAERGRTARLAELGAEILRLDDAIRELARDCYRDAIAAVRKDYYAAAQALGVAARRLLAVAAAMPPAAPSGLGSMAALRQTVQAIRVPDIVPRSGATMLIAESQFQADDGAGGIAVEQFGTSWREDPVALALAATLRPLAETTAAVAVARRHVEREAAPSLANAIDRELARAREAAPHPEGVVPLRGAA